MNYLDEDESGLTNEKGTIKLNSLSDIKVKESNSTISTGFSQGIIRSHQTEMTISKQKLENIKKKGIELAIK
ncbi:hypothetical protein BLOT_003064 [Blomia tropicalis]|nr:hypothetical protein BLOT_003064 [Blomia tropicalis]